MKGTITTNQRLANLEANKHRLISDDDKEMKVMVNALVVFALNERKQGNNEYMEIIDKWETSNDEDRLRLYNAMEKANPSWREDSTREIERRGY